MTDGIKAFWNIWKADTSGLIIIYILQPVINNAVKTSLRGVTFQDTDWSNEIKACSSRYDTSWERTNCSTILAMCPITEIGQ